MDDAIPSLFLSSLGFGAGCLEEDIHWERTCLGKGEGVAHKAGSLSFRLSFGQLHARIVWQVDAMIQSLYPYSSYR